MVLEIKGLIIIVDGRVISCIYSLQGQHLENILQSGKIYSEFEQIPKLTLVCEQCVVID